MSLLMLMFLINSAGVSGDKPNSGCAGCDSLRVKPRVETTLEEPRGEMLQYTFGMDAYNVGFNKSSISTNILEEQINTSNGNLELKIKLLSLPMRGNKDYDLYLTYRGSPLSMPGVLVNRTRDFFQGGTFFRLHLYGYNLPNGYVEEWLYERGDSNTYLVTADMGNCGLGWNVTPGEVSLNANWQAHNVTCGSTVICKDLDPTARKDGFINLNGQSYNIYSVNWGTSWNVKGKRNWKFKRNKLYTPDYTYETDLISVLYPNPRFVESTSRRELCLLSKMTDRNGNYVEFEWYEEVYAPPGARIPKKICTPTDTCYIYIDSIPVDTNERLEENPDAVYPYCLWDFYVIDSIVKNVNGEKFKVNFYYHQEWYRAVMEYWYGHAFVLLDSIEFLKDGDRIKPPYRFKYSNSTTSPSHRQGELIEMVAPDSAKYEYFYNEKKYFRTDNYGDDTLTTWYPYLSKYRVVDRKVVTLPDAAHIESGNGSNIYEYNYTYGKSVGPNFGEWLSPIGMGGYILYSKSYFPIYDFCRIDMPDTGSITYFNVDSTYVDNLLKINYRNWTVVVDGWPLPRNCAEEEDVILPFEREEFYGRPYKIVTSNSRNMRDGNNYRLKAEHFYWTISEEVLPCGFTLERPLHPFLRYKAVQLDPDGDSIEVGEKAYVYHYEEYDQYDNQKKVCFLGEATLTGTSSYTMQFVDDVDLKQSWEILGMPEWSDNPSDNWEVRKDYVYEQDSDYADSLLYNLVDSAFKSDYNGNLVQKTKFEYDNPSHLVNIDPNPLCHDPGYGTSRTIRGNLTKKTEWINENETRSQQYWYDICGNLVEMKDYMGEEYGFEYDNKAVFPERKIYPDNSNEHFNFDRKGNLRSFTDRSSIVSEFKYDIYGRISEVKKGIHAPPIGMCLLGKYQYDDFNRKAKEITYKSTGSSDTTIYSYDGLGRLINFKKCAPTSVVVDYIYNGDGQLIKETLPRFSDVSLYDADYTIKTFDGLGRVTEIEYPKSSSESGVEVVTYEYRGNTTEVIDEKLNHTTLINDASGNLITVEDALGYYTDYYYDVNGKLLEIEDADVPRKHTYFEYDWLGNLIGREGPDRGENTFEYYPDGQVELHVNNSGDSIFYGYDELGRITTKGGPGLYDPPPVYITDTLFYDTETGFIKPDSVFGNSIEWDLNMDVSQWGNVNISFETKCGYKPYGGAYQVEGKCSLYVYFEDPDTFFVRRFEIFEGSTGANSWNYPPHIFPVDPVDYGNIISGIKIKHTGKAKGSFPCGYPCNPYWADSIKNVTVEVGVLDSLPYTVLGDTLEEYFYDNYTIKGTTYTPPSGLTYSRGRLTGFENENIREVYFYDQFSNLREKLVIPFKADNVVAREFEYSYDLQGRLTRLDFPSHGVEYEYDKLGNILSVEINGNETINLSSTAAGLLSGIDFPGGVTDTFSYLPRNWMDSMGIVKGASILHAVDFTYNKRGELLEEKRYAPSPQITVAEYTYDPLGRLIEEDREGTENDYSFTYDAVGNRNVVDGITYQYIYQTNKLIYDGPNTYDYNDIGCIKSKSDVNGEVNFYYDSKGRLTGVCDEDGNGYKYYYKGSQRIREEKLSDIDLDIEGFSYYCELQWDKLPEGELRAIFLDENNDSIGSQKLEEFWGPYTYDWQEFSGQGSVPPGTFAVQLSVKIVEPSGEEHVWVNDMYTEGLWSDDISGTPEEEYNYFYDNAGNLVMIEDENGGLYNKTQYIYAGNRLIAKLEGSNVPFFYHLDRIGSPIMITDVNGNVVKQKKYEAFGNLVWASGTHDDKREFTGKEKDPTGFHYFGARYYSGDIGRFLTPDPHTVGPGNLNLRDPQTLNPYVYCTNDPLILIDPNGLQSFDPMIYYNAMTHEFESAVNQLISAGKVVIGLPGKAANDLVGSEVVSAVSGSSGLGFGYTLTSAAFALEGGLTKAEAFGIAASFSATTGSALIKLGTLTGPGSEGYGAILGYGGGIIFYGIAGGFEILATKARLAEINGEIYIIWPKEREPIEEENLRLEFNPDDIDFNSDNNSHFNRSIDVNWDPFYFDPKRDNAGSCEYWQ